MTDSELAMMVCRALIMIVKAIVKKYGLHIREFEE